MVAVEVPEEAACRLEGLRLIIESQQRWHLTDEPARTRTPGCYSQPGPAMLQPHCGGAVGGSGRPPNAVRPKPNRRIGWTSPQSAERHAEVEREGEGERQAGVGRHSETLTRNARA